MQEQQLLNISTHETDSVDVACKYLQNGWKLLSYIHHVPNDTYRFMLAYQVPSGGLFHRIWLSIYEYATMDAILLATINGVAVTLKATGEIETEGPAELGIVNYVKLFLMKIIEGVAKGQADHEPPKGEPMNYMYDPAKDAAAETLNWLLNDIKTVKHDLLKRSTITVHYMEYFLNAWIDKIKANELSHMLSVNDPEPATPASRVHKTSNNSYDSVRAANPDLSIYPITSDTEPLIEATGECMLKMNNCAIIPIGEYERLQKLAAELMKAPEPSDPINIETPEPLSDPKPLTDERMAELLKEPMKMYHGKTTEEIHLKMANETMETAINEAKHKLAVLEVYAVEQAFYIAPVVLSQIQRYISDIGNKLNP